MVGGDDEQGLLIDALCLVRVDQATKRSVETAIHGGFFRIPFPGPVADRVNLGQVDHHGARAMSLESFDGKVHDQTVLLPEGKGIIGQRDGAVVAGWQLDSERAIVQKSRGDRLRSEGEWLPPLFEARELGRVPRRSFPAGRRSRKL